jgi:hypothetical protein
MPITIADFHSWAVLAVRVNRPIAMHGFQKLSTMAELLAFEEVCRLELYEGMICVSHEIALAGARVTGGQDSEIQVSKIRQQGFTSAANRSGDPRRKGHVKKKTKKTMKADVHIVEYVPEGYEDNKDEYPYSVGDHVLLIEIENMPGHCAVILKDGRTV